MESSTEVLLEKQRLNDLAIQGLSQQYPKIPQEDIRKVFGYLENFCKLTNNGNVRLQIFKSSGNCSIFWMKGKVDLFFLNCARTYTRMDPKQVIVKMLGQEAYNTGFESYSTSAISNINDGDDHGLDAPLLEGETQKQIKGSMEDVDGGTKRKRNKNKKTKKGKSKKNKTKKRRGISKKLRKTSK